MGIKTQVLELGEKTIKKWNNLLESDNLDYDDLGFPKMTTVAKWTVKFDDGCEADLKVNTNSREDGDLYSECVLFDENGCQLNFTEPEYAIDGDWHLWYNSTEYVVKVI